MRRYFMILAVLGGLIFFTHLKAHSEVTVGQPAPDFELQNTHGQAVKLSDFKGKFVVLEWFNLDCPFVQKHYNSGNMQNLQKSYTQKDVVWLSINSSAPGKEGNYSAEDTNAKMQEKGAASTAFLLDPDGKVGRLYGAKATPHMFIVNPDGNLIYQGAIDDTPTFDPADVSVAKNYVSKALDEAMAGKAVTTASTKAYGCSVKYKE